MKKNKNPIFLAVVLFSVYSAVSVLLISKLVYDNPVDYNKIRHLYKDFLSLKFEFKTITDALSELFLLLLLLYIFMMLYHLATSIGKKLYTGNYFYSYSRKIKTILSDKRIVIISIIFTYCVMNESYFLFFCLCWITFFNLLYIFIVRNIFSRIKYLNSLFKLEKKTDLKIKKNLILYYLFVLSMIISLAITFIIKEYKFFAVYQFILYVLFVLIYFLFSELTQILKADYQYAKKEKEYVVNEYIIDKIWTMSKDNLWSASKDHFLKTLKKVHFNLKIESEFEEAINEADFSNDFKKILMKNYKKLAIEYKITSELQAEIIIIRNKKNLYASIFFIIFLAFVAMINNYIYIIANYRDEIFKVLFSVVCFRLLTRSIEIGYSFFKDIRPETKIKNTNISNSKRMSLVLNSLLEIILLCATLYTIVYLLIEDNTSNFLEFFYIGLTHSIATAAFNSSFPYDILINIKFVDQTYLKVPNSEFWNWLTVIQILHIIQLIMSIILISLSITSYGSKTNNEFYINIKYASNNYFIEEVHKSTEIKKILFQSSDINSLMIMVYKEWDKSSNSKLTSNQFIQVIELLEISLLKV